MIERVTTGIPGLDKLMGGGFVKGSSNLIAGSTGTCKTIFSCQYILEGLKKGEPGLYISLEQTDKDILNDMQVFGWDQEFKKYMDQKKLLIYSEFPSNIRELKDQVSTLVKRIGAKRFVLDSISIATMGWKETTEIPKLRRDVFDFMDALKNLGVTCLLITEIPEGQFKALSRYGFEEFLADGIIVMHYLEFAAGGTPRSLLIRKMRRTDHGSDIYPIQITKSGLKILSPEKGLVI